MMVFSREKHSDKQRGRREEKGPTDGEWEREESRREERLNKMLLDDKRIAKNNQWTFKTRKFCFE